MHPLEDASGTEQFLLRQASQTRIPINGSIELLPLCNMNCRMCYVRLSQAEQQKLGPIHTASEWIELGKQMQQCGTLFLLLTGGEPLLHPEFKEIYLGLKSLGMLLTVNTNATMINEEWADFFGKYHPRRINITLYGKDDATYERLCRYPGGFTKAIQAIKLLRNREVPVKVSVSLTPENQGQLSELHEICESLGVPIRGDTYMMPAERERALPFDRQNRLTPKEAANAQFLALQREMGKELFDTFVCEKMTQIAECDRHPQEFASQHMSCLAGSCSFTVNWQGNLRPCVILSEPSESVFETGFEKSWSAICSKIDKIRLSQTCTACRLRSLCRTCAASALTETGSYDGVPDYMCQFAKESLNLLEAYLRQEKEPE